METSKENDKILEALFKARKEMTPALKKGYNPHTKSKFASLESISDACKHALVSNGILDIQSPTFSYADQWCLMTIFIHLESQQWIRNFTPIINSKGDAQGLGAAITYSRRYGLVCLTGLIPEDDDGHSACKPATDHAPPKQTYKPTPTKQTQPSKQDEDFMALKITLEADDIDTSVLKPYIMHLSKQSNKTTAKVLESALRPELLDRFKERYREYLERFEPSALAV